MPRASSTHPGYPLISVKHELQDWMDGPRRLVVGQPKPFVYTSSGEIRLIRTSGPYTPNIKRHWTERMRQKAQHITERGGGIAYHTARWRPSISHSEVAAQHITQRGGGPAYHTARWRPSISHSQVAAQHSTQRGGGPTFCLFLSFFCLCLNLTSDSRLFLKISSSACPRALRITCTRDRFTSPALAK